MRAARDERDVRAGFSQRSSKTASDAAGADYCNPHHTLPVRTCIPKDQTLTSSSSISTAAA